MLRCTAHLAAYVCLLFVASLVQGIGLESLKKNLYLFEKGKYLWLGYYFAGIFFWKDSDIVFLERF
jgi:hypothetical protein